MIVEVCASSAAHGHLLCCQVRLSGPNLRSPRRSLPRSPLASNRGARRCPARLNYAATSSSSSFQTVFLAILWMARPAVCAGTATSCGVIFTPRLTTCTARAADEGRPNGRRARQQRQRCARRGGGRCLALRPQRGHEARVAALCVQRRRPLRALGRRRCVLGSYTSPASRCSSRPSCERCMSVCCTCQL